MKKKLIATLVAGAVLSTGIIGLTACGGGKNINKGEKVDADGWKTAITATGEAKNFTLDSYSEATMKVTGSVEELGLSDLDISVVSKGEGKAYYDLENGYYSKSTVKGEVSGVPDALKDEDDFKAENYVVEEYSVKDGDKYYAAYYDGSSETPEWSVSDSSTAPEGGIVSYLLNQSFATEEGGTTAKIIDLYESFEYSGGVYTATLWTYSVEVTVSVSIKGGYVVGVSSEYSYDHEEGGAKTVFTQKAVYNFSKYGKTTVKASDDAKKAVDDYKAN